MFQRPRTVALEYEKPGMYGTGLIPPTRPFDRVWLRGLRDNHLQLGLVVIMGTQIRESRINLVATPRAECSSRWYRFNHANDARSEPTTPFDARRTSGDSNGYQKTIV
ncbi:hypothetical protein PIB30_087167 [Stylosanthes scabra]|uniref:Uncharacterized protein n=1 Tax=Stylosanthes scabra TaxID=79078 RepID=A0ABU6QTB7_9FABA|nr:hypothetical protein [Stylosanthes scabra]